MNFYFDNRVTQAYVVVFVDLREFHEPNAVTVQNIKNYLLLYDSMSHAGLIYKWMLFYGYFAVDYKNYRLKFEIFP